MSTNTDLYRAMCRIRRFEETILEQFSSGVFSGTTHTYLGQEANAVGVISQLGSDDIIFSNHRCHGHFLAYGGDLQALFAELMGKPAGICGGRGGSQHIHWKNFYSNGIQGSIVPLATGMALAEKLQGNGVIAVAFLGDGTLGEGVIYESFNLAALWGAPVLYVVEDNRIAQTTPAETALAGDIATRFEAFDIPTTELDSSDVNQIAEAAGECIAAVRTGQHPHALILHTCRFGPHSKGDDTRPPEAVEQMRAARDPLTILGAQLEEGERTAVDGETTAEVAAAFAGANAA
ncbi:MAG: thiamine pyrophosphate-dependent dehydrogenase E1 component subunit alpha [Anaerolineales bacterium]|nr:thiamine pyrophosphate-dependent dehydrogenase E1 component subunit alpha [Anaerolineales bacterium]